MNIRTRIAPSPTGFPHIGTIFQALINYAYAKKSHGDFIVRIEDTDQSRQVEGAIEVIFSALSWFGLEPDESPIHGGSYGPYQQSQRLNIYLQHAQELINKDHAYYCFCTPDRLSQVRLQMQKQGLPPMYDKHCRSLDKVEASKRALNEPHVIRLKVPSDETITFTDEIRGKISFESKTVDDQVLIKSDGFPTYHLAVVVDDHLMNITHTVRGEEWISSTPKHVLLYRYFNWQMPKLIHTPLLRNPDKSKLSKRHGHTSVEWYQQQGYLKEAVLNFLATRIWNHPNGQEIFNLDEFIQHFEFKDMHIQGPIVDLKKLDWINGQWIRRLSSKKLFTLARPWVPNECSDEMLKKILPLIHERLVKLSELPELVSYFHDSPSVSKNELLKQSKMDADQTLIYLQKVKKAVSEVASFNADALESSLRNLQHAEGLKPRQAFMTIRVAITGTLFTPPLFDVMEILGQQECLIRLDNSINSLI